MATLRWLGRAAAVAQVTTVTVGGTVEADDLFILTINGKALSVVAGSTTPATVAATIAAAWEALDGTLYPEFAAITATSDSADVVLTADAEGVPFTVTASTTEAGGGAADLQTFVAVATTAASGPNHWSAAANWDTGAVPVTGDTVYVEGNSVPILYGLAQGAVTLAALHVRQDYLGTIGLPEVNADGAAPYAEYRDQYLTIGATVMTIGEGPGQGSGRIKIDNSTVQTLANVYNTGSPAEQDVPSLLWKGTHADNVVNVFKGDVGVAHRGKDVATVATFRVGYQQGEFTDSRVFLGNGVTLTTLLMQGGTVDARCAATTITKNGGELTLSGAGAYTTISQWSGTLNYRSSGTVTNLFVGAALVDFRADMRARTVDNCDVYAGAQIQDPQGSVTWTDGVNLNACDLTQVSLNLGRNVKITPAAL